MFFISSNLSLIIFSFVGTSSQSKANDEIVVCYFVLALTVVGKTFNNKAQLSLSCM